MSPLLLLALLIGERVWSSTSKTPAPLAPEPIAHRPSVEERVIKESTTHQLPPHIALNVAWEESRFQEHKVSSTHDYGVMQLNRYSFPSAPHMTTDENIRAGVALLAKYWKQSHSERLTKMAYRYGPSVLK